MTEQEQRDLNDGGRPFDEANKDTVRGGTLAVQADATVARRAAPAFEVIPEGWELLPAGGTRKVWANSEFIQRGTFLPAWKVESPDGTTDRAFEVEYHPSCRFAMRSAANPDRSVMGEPCGLAWVEVTGPILIRRTRA